MKNRDKKIWALCLLLPPVISIFISLNELVKNRGKIALYRFLICLVTIIAYWYVAYDTILKFWNVNSMKYYSNTNLLEGDPLSNIAYLCNPFIDYYYFMFLYWLLSGYFFYTAIYSQYQNKLSIVGIILMIFGLNLTNMANLTYFTLSCTCSIYMSDRIDNNIKNIILAIILIYLFHPGMLLCFLPSIPLFYLWKIGFLKLSLAYLVLYDCFSHLFFNSGLSSFLLLGDNDIVNEHIQAYENYTGDGKWGIEGLQYGIRGQIWFFLLYTTLGVGLFLVYKYFMLLRTKFVTAIFIIATITLINSRHLYTFSERMGIAALLSCIVIISVLDSQQILKVRMNKLVVSLVIISYLSSLIMFVQPRKDMFINYEKGYDVSLRSCIVPTALCIFDLHHIGYSDSYLLQNGRNRHK